jgi:ankyrin repeat protein
MFGSTLKRYSCLALLILTTSAAPTVVSAQTLVPTKPAASAANEFLADLIASIERDDKLGVMRALSQGFPLDVMDSNGNTMLIQAAKGGRVKVTQYLLDSGADPNIMATNGATPLIFAVNGGHASTVAALLKMNADPNLRDRIVPPALTFAAANGNTEIMQMLIKAGATLNALDQKGYNALEFAFLNQKSVSLNFLRPVYRSKAAALELSPANFARAIAEKNDDAIIRALALGFDPNRTINGKTPLEIAKQAGYEKGISLLIHAGATETKETVAANKQR